MSNLTNAVGKVKISKVDSNPQVINPNGATNYRGQFVYCGEGQGADITSTLYLMNPKARYNTTGKLMWLNGGDTHTHTHKKKRITQGHCS